MALSRPGGPQRLYRIEWWRTRDGGATWRREQAISDADKQNVRPFYIRGAPAEVNWWLMWLRGTYGEYGDFDLSLFGGAS